MSVTAAVPLISAEYELMSVHFSVDPGSKWNGTDVIADDYSTLLCRYLDLSILTSDDAGFEILCASMQRTACSEEIVLSCFHDAVSRYKCILQKQQSKASFNIFMSKPSSYNLVDKVISCTV